MDREKNWIEYNCAMDILISLLDGKKNYTTLLSNIDKSNYGTINKTLRSLQEVALIKDEKKETTEEGKYVGIPRHIWLTEKGENIAEKLIEIKEIMKKNKDIKRGNK